MRRSCRHATLPRAWYVKFVAFGAVLPTFHTLT
jgi:hypothetical protein